MRITQETDYPVSDSILLTVDQPADMAIALRIPAWSTANIVTVNGQPVPAPKAGEYCVLNRVWRKGDKIALKLDLGGRVVYNGNYTAILRGPVVLARDSRFPDAFPDDVALPQQKNGRIKLTPYPPRCSDVDGIFCALH
jgi:DUF1680 family protein